MERNSYFSFLLRFSCFLIFFGRAWQHLIWDAPFRAFFWDQNLLEGIVTSLTGKSWFEYVTDPATDSFITALTRGFGVFYLGMAVLTLIVNSKMRWSKWVYYISCFSLAILALLYCKEKFYHSAQFFEYSIQFLTPVFFSLYLQNQSHEKLLFYLKLAIALTFVSHGMYAFGYYPRPGVFVDMTINILGVSESVAHQFLKVAGILDFVVGIGIFLPRYSWIFLLYAAVWGLATAIARVWANIEFDSRFLALLNQYLPQMLYRLPHGLIPLSAYVLLVSKNSTVRNLKWVSH